MLSSIAEHILLLLNISQIILEEHTVLVFSIHIVIFNLLFIMVIKDY